MKVESPRFLFRAEGPGLRVFFEETERLGPYIKSGPRRIRSLDA